MNPRSFAHDLKNMLGIVIGYSNVLLDEIPADAPHRADVQEILRAGEKALALVEEWQQTAAPGDEAT